MIMLEDEHDIIANMLLRKGGLNLVRASGLEESDFANKRTRAMFAALSTRLYPENLPQDCLADPTSLPNGAGDTIGLFREMKAEDPSITHSFFSSLFDSVPDLSGLKWRCARVLELSRGKILDSLGNTMSGSSGANVNERVGKIQKALDELTRRSQSDAFGEIGSQKDRLLNPTGEEIEPGTKIGFPLFDAATAGIQPGRIYVVAARPGIGKTMFALNAAANAAMLQNKLVFFISLEMTAKDLENRLVARETNTSLRQIVSGFTTDSERNRISKFYANPLSKNISFWHGGGITTTAFEQLCSTFIARHGPPDLVILDYLGCLRPDTDQRSAYGNMTSVVNFVTAATRRLRLPLLCLAQLNRQIEGRTSGVPNLSDLRDSGAIEQDADLVAFLYDESEKEKNYKRQTIGETSLAIAKNRHGNTAKLQLLHNLATQRLDEKGFE